MPPIFRRFMFLHIKVFPPYFFCRLKENSSKFYGFTLFFTKHKFLGQLGLLWVPFRPYCARTCTDLPALAHFLALTLSSSFPYSGLLCSMDLTCSVDNLATNWPFWVSLILYRVGVSSPPTLTLYPPAWLPLDWSQTHSQDPDNFIKCIL